MESSAVQEKMESLTKEFDALTKERGVVVQRIQEIDQGLLRLQGAYKALSDLLVVKEAEKAAELPKE